MFVSTDREKIKEILNSRYIEKIFPSKKALEKALLSGKRLRLYIGIDPTGPQLHLGHSTNFFLLKKFQKLGHEVIFLIGDFTARIGDPTGKLKARKALTEKEVKENCKSYKEQVKRIIDVDSKENPVRIVYNSSWLSKLTLEEVIKLAGKVTVGQMIKRDMFQRRIKEKREIYLHEFLYPLLQGYDSVYLDTDIEVGGNDQTFNMMIGRDLMKIYRNKEKFVITTKLLINPKTGKKLMSKSEGNYIALNDPPNEMYGKVMALPDEVIIPCLKLATEVEDEKIKKFEKEMREGKINPREVKAFLAFEIVKIYHGEKKAIEAEKEFERVFKEKRPPQKMPLFVAPKSSYPLAELLVNLKLCPSKSEAKRLIKQGAVKIDGEVKTNWKEKIIIKKEGIVIKVGKRKFAKIVLS